MMNYLKFIKYFENFTKNKLEKIISSKNTYIKIKMKSHKEYSDSYEKCIKDIREYDISNFNYNQKPYGIYITPDKEFLNIIKKLNELIDNKINSNLEFDFSIDEKNINLIDFNMGIPKQLKGLRLGYKLYKLVINNVLYITSNNYTSDDAINIWYYLMIDKDFFCFTSKTFSGVIHKKSTDNIIKDVLEKIKNKDLIFDDELTEKITQLYGSMDIYTQKHK